MNNPKILVLDIETSPLITYTWSLFDNDSIALNQLHTDWHILSFAAKWYKDSEVHYMDQSKEKDITNDKKLLKGIWKLLDEADIVLTQNGKKFDIKKLNARFILNDMPPPSPFRQIDTLTLAKKHFAFTSNKLAYMTSKLCVKKKSEHKKFSGFDLWKECLAGNSKAWAEMKSYNIMDIVSLEELYSKMQPWDTSINFNVYSQELNMKCNCENERLQKRGFSYTNKAKRQRYQCTNCGSWMVGTTNHLSKEKIDSLKGK
jgi:DNA polymerase III epsilon subunit-like protein